jgi:hypothetical protein
MEDFKKWISVLFIIGRMIGFAGINGGASKSYC